MTCSFTLEHYFETLQKYKDVGYTIGPVSSFLDKTKHIILRHDIDLSLDYATELSKHEYNNGYKTSYHILLHSVFFNALEPNNIILIKNIAALHEVGLHVDTNNLFLEEFNLLGNICNRPITQFSQDQPNYSPPVPQFLNDIYFNTAHTISKYEYKYLSDSGKNWREGCFCKWVNKTDKIHVLTHPIWWLTKNITEFNYHREHELSGKLKQHSNTVEKYLEELKK